ncbi:MAG: class I adenylate-forming enzyme family protein [Acidimicrobiales bacterium]
MTVHQIDPGTRRTAVELLRRAAAMNSDVEAYVEPSPCTQLDAVAMPPGLSAGSWSGKRRSLTFAAWDRAADGLAGHLSSCGVGRGDVVALVLPSSLDYAVSYAAALRLGAVTSGLNPRLGPAEQDSIFARSRPSVTIVDPDLGWTLPAIAGRIVSRSEAAASWSGAPPSRLPVIHDDDPVAVVWTSGTTGVPKGAVFDHRSLEAVSTGAGVLSRPGDRRLSPLPFAHVGYMTKVWDEIAHGVTTVITPLPWRAESTLSIMASERVTVAQGVPTQWALLVALDGLDRFDLASLRIAGAGGAPMPAPLVAEVRRRFGVPVVVRYASTETAICTGTLPDDPDHVVADTVGRPVSGVSLDIVDDGDRSLSDGAIGNVRIRSGAVMLGYWGPPDPSARRPDTADVRGATHVIDADETARVRSVDGWVKTGDLGVIDIDGNLRLVGRKGERYIRGGYNVYPAEVEEALVTHPLVSRAVVLGASDPVLGEVGVAFVVPASGGEAPLLADLRAHCRKALADYKAPDAVVVLEQLPLTPMMKVDKRSLRGAAAAAAKRRQILSNTTSGTAITDTDPVIPGKEQRQ